VAQGWARTFWTPKQDWINAALRTTDPERIKRARLAYQKLARAHGMTFPPETERWQLYAD
jgi:hypothetical protein